jgi:superfamily II DNA or RNA helicase
VANSYQLILKRFPKAKVVGLTATPVRTDGRGLGELFDEIVMSLTPAELTELGHLVPCRVFAPSAPDLTGVHTARGDYDQKELAAATDKPKLIGDIVDHYGRLARGRKAVAFGTSISHSKHIVESFVAAGIVAEHLDGTTPAKQRDATMERFSKGGTMVVSNVGVWTEGVDVPIMSCAILARPTQSTSLYLQMVGRILRPYPEKRDAIVLDHAGATLQHGFVTDDRGWSLDGARKNGRKKDKDDEVTVRICLDCYMAYPATMLKCPGCGFKNAVKERQIETEEGELVEVQPYTIRKLSRNPQIARLQKIAEGLGYKPGWCFHNMQRLRSGLPLDIPEKAMEWERLNG